VADLEVVGQLEKYHPRSGAKLLLYAPSFTDEDVSAVQASEGTVRVAVELLPERGVYQGAYVHVALTAAAEPRGVSAERGPDRSVHEPRAVARDDYDEGWTFRLEDPDTGEELGDGNTEAEAGGYRPEPVAAAGDACYLTVEATYDRTFNLEHWHYDEAEIAEERERAREVLGGDGGGR
jgi:hypothetical protein